MFVAHYENTMRNARFKVAEPVSVRTMEQIRAEKRAEAEEVRRQEFKAWYDRVRAEEEEARQRLSSIQAVLTYRVIEVRDAKPLVRPIIDRIAALHGMKFERIVGIRRDHKSVAARFDAIEAVAKARPDLSLPQIGRHFNRDHTTIMHALRRRGVPDRRSSMGKD